jgi:hypothetical protein
MTLSFMERSGQPGRTDSKADRIQRRRLESGTQTALARINSIRPIQRDFALCLATGGREVGKSRAQRYGEFVWIEVGGDGLNGGSPIGIISPLLRAVLRNGRMSMQGKSPC